MSPWIEIFNVRGHKDDLMAAASMLTRVPVATQETHRRRAAWAWPVVGAFVGVSAGAVAVLALALGTGAGTAAVLALAVSVLLTGCMHEDGLADTADGLWGGADAGRRMDIMRDSATGAYGAAALLLIFLGRFTGISESAGGASLIIILAVSGALSRAVMLAAMSSVPQARKDGFAAACGQPSRTAVWTGGILALSFAGAALGWQGLAAAAAAGAAGTAISLLARRKIGGHTGDTLGATQQTAETACLLTLAGAL